MLKNLLLAGTLLVGAMVAPAEARLQLSINVGASTFTCFDGQLGCDVSGGANNLLTINQLVGGAFVQITLAQSTFGAHNTLQLSSSNILNETSAPITVSLLASDTNFIAPVSFINNSGSLTFNANIPDATDSTLAFWADPFNTQGADPLNTPGSLLELVSGHATSDPDSFAGSRLSAFSAGGPFSMTEGASLALRAGGSVTGFDQSMTTGVPEPKTWAMLGIGFGLMALLSAKKVRKDRLATIA